MNTGLRQTMYTQLPTNEVEVLKEAHKEDPNAILDIVAPFVEVECPLCDKEYTSQVGIDIDEVFEFMPLLGALRLLYGLFSEYPPMEGETLKLSCAFLTDAQDKINKLYSQYGDDSPFDQKTLMKFVRHGFDIPACWIANTSKDPSNILPRTYGFGEKNKRKFIPVKSRYGMKVVDGDRPRKNGSIHTNCLKWIEDEVSKEPKTIPEIVRMAELQWPEVPWFDIVLAICAGLVGQHKLSTAYLVKDWDTGKITTTEIKNSSEGYGYEFIVHMGWDKLETPGDIKKKDVRTRLVARDTFRKVRSYGKGVKSQEDAEPKIQTGKKRGRPKRLPMC